MRKVLVFAPHPDDDVIGCGGSILKHIKMGSTVEVIYITSGETGSTEHSPDKVLAIREAEARAAAKLLGVSQTHFLRYPDGALCYSRESIVEIMSMLRVLKPDIVYIPHKYDEHHDHRITYELVMEACVWSGGGRAFEVDRQPWPVGTILCYEVGTPLHEVNYVEDISEMIATKTAAMRLHESQMAVLPFDEAVKNLSRLRGIMTGHGQYCECFQVRIVSKI